MWRQIKIGQRSYLISCVLGEDGDMTFILYDNKESWCEVQTLVEVKRKAKLLNRRYDYSEEIIRDTLLSGDLELATLESDQQAHGRSEKMSLKLKYRVKNCPFHYEWSLKHQTVQEIYTTFVKSLCTALMGCQEQLAILTDSLRKKDAEILQYRKEGAILNRKTLATKLFDFEEFGKKFESSNKIVTDFAEFGKFITNSERKKEETRGGSPRTSLQDEKQRGEEERGAAKQKLDSMSPGQRKRKILEMRRNLNNRKQCIEYESSQSQATTTNSSQSMDEMEHKVEEPKSITNTQQMIKQDSVDIVSSANATQKDQPKNTDVKLSGATTQKSQQKNQDPPESKNNQNNNSTLNTATIQKTRQKDRDSFKSNSNQGDPTRTGSASPKKPSTPKVKNFIEFDSDSESDEILSTTTKPPTKCAPTRTPSKRPADDSQSDSDDIILTPRKITRSKPTKDDKTNNSEKRSAQEDDRRRKQNRNGSNKEADSTPNNRKVLRCLDFEHIPPAEVVELSTDSECSEKNRNALTARYPKRRHTTNTPTKNPLKTRVTRSSPNSQILSDDPSQLLRRRRNSLEMSAADMKIFKSSMNGMSKSPTKQLIVGQISSQLDAIRKELESLEALRLADLKKRTCKA